MLKHIHTLIGAGAGLIGLLAFIPYSISTVRGITKPNCATWLIWTLVGGLLAVSFASEGDIHAIWVPICYFIGPLLITILSLRYGHTSWNKLDTICVIAAIISLIPWFLAKNAILTLLINVLIDSTGAIPTLVKTYHEPETEDFTAWLFFLIANTFNLFAITKWNLADIYPVYLFILSAVMIGLIYKDKIKAFLSANKME